MHDDKSATNALFYRDFYEFPLNFLDRAQSFDKPPTWNFFRFCRPLKNFDAPLLPKMVISTTEMAVATRCNLRVHILIPF